MVNFFKRSLQANCSWLALAIFVWSVKVDTASAMPSLADQYPPDKLAQVLLPIQQWRPFPVCTNRTAWEALPGPVKIHLARMGGQALTNPFPPLPATLYLEYARVGNRSRFQKDYFERRDLLRALVLAECVEGQRRFLDAAANALWAICEESSWCLPAHVGRQKGGVGLPNVEEPIVDLFAAETGVAVAWTLYLLSPELERVSVRLPQRAWRELEGRILRPVQERDDFGWMALRVNRVEDRPNNWTPWIAASVLTAALVCDTNAERRVAVTHKMMRSLDGFLKFHPADGGCDEGPGYWNRAGGSALDCLDLLHSASGGRLDWFGDPLIREVGRFICRAHIAGDYYVPIGDCSARMEPERSLVYRYGKRVGDPDLLATATSQATVETILPTHQFFGRQIFSVFNAADLLANAGAKMPAFRDTWLESPDLQFMAARSRAGSFAGLYVAAWGAHNAQSHNHNDVGNVLVFMNGKPVFIDPGAPTYTAATFSAKRYDLWAFQSQYHNLPTINGVMQEAGRRFAAGQVSYQANDATAELTLDLAGAYPPSAQVKSWRRKVTLVRDQFVEIRDHYALSALAGKTRLHFMSAEPFEVNREPGRINFSPATGVRVEFDPAKLTPSVETIPLTDERLAHSWGSALYRLSFDLKTPALEDTVAIRIVPTNRVTVKPSAQPTRSFAPPPKINYREPVRAYVERQAGRWTFHLERELVERNSDTAEQVMQRLAAKLEVTLGLFPAHARDRLRKLALFVLFGSQATAGGRDSGTEYFRSADPDFHPLLDPRWRSAVVIYSAKNYLWQNEHWAMQLLVHELAHAWHLEQWPEKQPQIVATWEKAKAAGLYRGVKDVNGNPVASAYAAHNQIEYFAELSCAYFWRGEYEPFDREALRRYDPPGFEMIERMWGVHAPPPPPSDRAGKVQ